MRSADELIQAYKIAVQWCKENDIDITPLSICIALNALGIMKDKP